MSILLDRHIEQTPGIRGGRPRIAGTRITVDDIVIMHRHLGQSLEQISGKYALLPAAVFAGMAYYYDHKDEIDRQIAQDDELADTLKAQNPAPLTERMRRMARG